MAPKRRRTTRRISEARLRTLYLDDKISPEVIGARYGISGRAVRNQLEAMGIPRLGPEHLRSRKKTGPTVSIPKSVLRRLYIKEKLSLAAIGKRYGLGSATIGRYVSAAGIPRQRHGHSLQGKKVSIPKRVLRHLYITERLSPETIGKRYGLHGRTIRSYLDDAGIPRLGPTHLRKGKSATWNKGLERSKEAREKNRIAHLGRVPANKGSGSTRFICEFCGIEVVDKPYRRKRFCSKDCKNQFNIVNDGEKHFNYKHGLDGATQRQRLWKRVHEWRRSVIRKSNGSCVVCGSKKRLEAHHLNNWANHPEERFAIENGTCLCKTCHRAFHALHGMKFCTKQMFHEWLNGVEEKGCTD